MRTQRKSKNLPRNQPIKFLKKPSPFPRNLRKIESHQALRVVLQTVVLAIQTLHKAVILLAVLYQVLRAIKRLEKRIKIINLILRIKIKKVSLRWLKKSKLIFTLSTCPLTHPWFKSNKNGLVRVMKGRNSESIVLDPNLTYTTKSQSAMNLSLSITGNSSKTSKSFNLSLPCFQKDFHFLAWFH